MVLSSSSGMDAITTGFCRKPVASRCFSNQPTAGLAVEREGSVALTAGKIEGLRGEVVDSCPPGAATAIGIRRVPVPG
jgi:hypothetical protein